MTRETNYEPRLARHQLTLAEYISHGLTDKEIARRLGQSERAIATQIVRARMRVGAYNRAHLAAIALRKGWIQ
jgi:DNA-binding NarL/FixJ family response regulator